MSRRSKQAQDAAKLDDSVLTPQERQEAEDFAQKIDLSDSNGIPSYGAGTQKKMADFSEQTLSSVRGKDKGEVGDMITNLIVQLKDFDVDEKETGLKALFHRSENRLVALQTKYNKVEKNADGFPASWRSTSRLSSRISPPWTRCTR